MRAPLSQFDMGTAVPMEEDRHLIQSSLLIGDSQTVSLIVAIGR